MGYSNVALLSLGIFLIINYDIILKKQDNFYGTIPAMKEYRRFLCAVLIFFGSDIIWGFLEEAKLISVLYIDTMIFFAEMAFAVFLWTRYVLAFIDEKEFFTLLLKYIGWFFLIFEWVVIIINIFLPILFYFDEYDNYQAGKARYTTMFIQLGMFIITSIYMFIVAQTSKENVKYKRFTIGVFGLVMAVFIFLQTFYPMLPLYSVGYIIGTCLLHTFVLEGYKKEQIKMLKELLEIETKQRKELSEARHMAYTDALTHVKNKHAYVEIEADIDRKIALKAQGEFGILVFDLNGLKSINDNLGHEIGDKYLKDACVMICNQFKHSAVFRIGGDEFVALLEGVDYQNIDNLLRDFNKQVEENITKKSIVISTGFERYNSDTDNSFNSIFVRADKKMYERKKILKDMGSI